MRIPPDKNTTTTRFGLLTAGDGHEYQVARNGFSSRSRKIRLVRAKVAECGRAGDVDGSFDAVRELFSLAFEPFYNPERIELLLDDDQLGGENLELLIAILDGDDLQEEQKKTSSEQT